MFRSFIKKWLEGELRSVWFEGEGEGEFSLPWSSSNGFDSAIADFVYIDNHISAFNEWFDSCENIFVYHVNEQDDDDNNSVSTDIPSKITEAMKMMHKLRSLATTKHPPLHELIDVYIDSHFSKGETYSQSRLMIPLAMMK